MRIKKLTPVLLVEEIESCLDFWLRLGFAKTAEVPHENRLGFVILAKDGIEVMYQTRGLMLEDVAALADAPQGGTYLYFEVDDLDAFQQALGATRPVVPRRKTFYGSDELIVREPGGNVVTFAQFAAQES